MALATGDVFSGDLVCRGDLLPGEVVLYNSAIFQYQILTDPVGYGRIIVSDSEFIDNRWPFLNEIESYSPHLKALVMLGELRNTPIQDNHYNLVNYLRTNGITFFKPDEPTQLKSLLNQCGPVRGIITDDLTEINQLYLKKTPQDLLSYPSYPQSIDDFDPVRKLSTRLEFFWDLPDQSAFVEKLRRFSVVAYDFGLAYSILRNIKKLGCDIRIVPADYSPEDVIALKPEGILLAGGPGDPGGMGYAISNISRLIGLRPILATGLGHLLLAAALGAKIETMKQPHFGVDIEVSRTGISGYNVKQPTFATKQSHLLGANRASLEKDGLKITLINSSDRTVEGFENEDYLIQSYAFSLADDDDFTLACLRGFISEMEAHRTGNRIF